MTLTTSPTMTIPELPVSPELPKSAAKQFDQLQEAWKVDDSRDLLAANRWVLWRVAQRHGVVSTANQPSR